MWTFSSHTFVCTTWIPIDSHAIHGLQCLHPDWMEKQSEMPSGADEDAPFFHCGAGRFSESLELVSHVVTCLGEVASAVNFDTFNLIVKFL